MKTIFVHNKDLGFWTQEPITVQRFTAEGEMLYCDHAGAVLEEVENEIPRIDEPDIVWTSKVWVCKCGAYRHDHESYWEDAPFEGKHNERA